MWVNDLRFRPFSTCVAPLDRWSRTKIALFLAFLRWVFFHIAAELLGSFLAINFYLWPWDALVYSTKCAEPNKFDGNMWARNGKLTEMPWKATFRLHGTHIQQTMQCTFAQRINVIRLDAHLFQAQAVIAHTFTATFQCVEWSHCTRTHYLRHASNFNYTICTECIALVAWESVLFDIGKINGNKCLITRHQTNPQRKQPTYLPLSLLLVCCWEMQRIRIFCLLLAGLAPIYFRFHFVLSVWTQFPLFLCLAAVLFAFPTNFHT